MTLTSFSLTVIVGFAGAFGAVSRYLLGRFITERINSQFPLGTFCINVSGAFVIGLLFALAGRKLISSALQATLATGFLGGYTTFSTMSWEGFQFVRGGSTPRSLLYLGGSALLGLLAAMLGLLLGGWLP
jgi:fluoride exporter